MEYQSPFCAVRYPKDRDREDMDAASVLDHMDLSYCQESARRKRCGRGGFFLKAFMNEYKTKQQGTQVDTTHVGSRVGSRVHTHARSVFSTTRALFTQITNTITFENSHAFENSQYNRGPVLPEGPSPNFS